MAFAPRLTPVIIRSPAQIQKAPAPKLFGLVIAQTTMLEHFIRELETVGALVVSLNL